MAGIGGKRKHFFTFAIETNRISDKGKNMLILRIIHKANRDNLDKTTRDEMARHGVIIEDLEASSLSTLTTMRIATRCKSSAPDIVLVDRGKDAMAAKSARDLSRKRETDFHIAFRTGQDDENLAHLPHSIATKIDMWCFNNKTTLDKATKVDLGSGKRFVVGRPSAMLHVEHTSAKNILIYIGDLGKCENLDKMVTAISNLDESRRPEIHVCGTGKARYITPVIKRTQRMGIDVKWLGDDYDIENEIALAQGFIVSDNELSVKEIQAMALGIPGVTADNLDEWIDPDRRSEKAEKAKERYRTEHAPEKVAARLKEIITELRK